MTRSSVFSLYFLLFLSLRFQDVVGLGDLNIFPIPQIACAGKPFRIEWEGALPPYRVEVTLHGSDGNHRTASELVGILTSYSTLVPEDIAHVIFSIISFDGHQRISSEIPVETCSSSTPSFGHSETSLDSSSTPEQTGTSLDYNNTQTLSVQSRIPTTPFSLPTPTSFDSESQTSAGVAPQASSNNTSRYLPSSFTVGSTPSSVDCSDPTTTLSPTQTTNSGDPPQTPPGSSIQNTNSLSFLVSPPTPVDWPSTSGSSESQTSIGPTSLSDPISSSPSLWPPTSTQTTGTPNIIELQKPSALVTPVSTVDQISQPTTSPTQDTTSGGSGNEKPVTTSPTQDATFGGSGNEKPVTPSESTTSSSASGSPVRLSSQSGPLQVDIQQTSDGADHSAVNTPTSDSQTQAANSPVLTTLVEPDGSTSTVTLSGSIADSRSPESVQNPGQTGDSSWPTTGTGPNIGSSPTSPSNPDGSSVANTDSPNPSPSSPTADDSRTPNPQKQQVGAIVGGLVGAFVVLLFAILTALRCIRGRRTPRWKRLDPFYGQEEEGFATREFSDDAPLRRSSESSFLGGDSSPGLGASRPSVMRESLIPSRSEAADHDNMEQDDEDDEDGSFRDSTSIRAVLPSRSSWSQASGDFGTNGSVAKEEDKTPRFARIPRGRSRPLPSPPTDSDPFSDSHMVTDTVYVPTSSFSFDFPAVSSGTSSVLIPSQYHQVPSTSTDSQDRSVAEVPNWEVERTGLQAEIKHLRSECARLERAAGLPPPAYNRLNR
ncbi:hypothetical protein K435DRAFT_968566 [Dendrothele bispora CBS 962.96]|uniref:Mid2 domain-containing protein n=1 Tax=Dendrothele bispora (strain CBS 962.96) TaxID=1314807 RepID=A0A4S8LN16_DENBC|nr:hypothetical protein K435DRAFT_968566 [Dendrothele bispora CBS 962.96]